MTQFTTGQASKFLVALFAAAASALATYYGTAKWEPVAVMVLGAAMTWLIPNTPASPQEPPVPPGGM